MGEQRKHSNRNYGIEALRIVSMCMIICHHLLVHGGVLDAAEPMTAGYWVAWLLNVLCIGAVNIYALISGFVGWDSSPKISRLIELWLRIVFHGIWITVLIAICFPETVSWINVINTLLPISTYQYWYLSAYFGLVLFMPILNIAIRQLPKKVLRNSLLGIFVVMCVAQTIIRKNPYGLGNGYSMIWLIILYLIGGYISKYRIEWTWKRWLVCSIGVSLLTFGSKLCIEYSTSWIFGSPKGGYLLVSYLSPTVIISAICIVLSAEKWCVPQWGIKYIKPLAAASVGVYMIHENNLVRQLLIKDRMTFLLNWNPVVMVLAVLGLAILIYLGCAIVDHLREKFFRYLQVRKWCDKCARLSR